MTKKNKIPSFKVLTKSINRESMPDILTIEDRKNTNRIHNKDIKAFLSNPQEFIKNVSNDNLIMLIQHLNHSYYINGQSLISDNLYDYVKEQLKYRVPDHPLLSSIGVSIGNKHKVNIPYHMGSMDKMKDNVEKINKRLQSMKNGIVLSDKLDGISALLLFKDDKLVMFGRGDSKYGMDISFIIPFINGIPYNFQSFNYNTMAIRGELIITKQNFTHIMDLPYNKGKVKNVRNTVNGVLSSQRPDLTIAKYIDFIAYELVDYNDMGEHRISTYEQYKFLHDKGFKVVNHNCNETYTTQDLSNTLIDRRQNGEYDIDGIIVTDNSPYIPITNGNPIHAFAFKDIMSQEAHEMLVLNVQWDISKDGYFCPVIIMEPTIVNGVVIKKANASNAKFIMDNKIGPGSKVLIIRSGDVIPYIKEVLTPSDAGIGQLPDQDTWQWNKSKVDIVLKDNIITENDDYKRKQLEHFIRKCGFKGIGPGLVDKLYNSGIKTIADFLKINTIEDLNNISGIGDKSKHNIVNTIHNTKSNITLITLMIASNKFGRGIGNEKASLVLNNQPYSQWDHLTPDDLLSIPGFNKITANKFIKGYHSFNKFLSHLDGYMPIMPNENQNSNNNNDIIHNEDTYGVVFSGFRDKAMELALLEKGIQVHKTIQKNTKLLVLADKDSTSNKTVKAKKHGITIIGKDEFYQHIN